MALLLARTPREEIAHVVPVAKIDSPVDRNGAKQEHLGPQRDRDAENRFQRLKKEMHERLIRAMDISALAEMDQPAVKAELRRGVEELCNASSELVNTHVRERLVNDIVAETFGLGPLETLLNDKSISDILINGPKTVFVERNGRLEESDVVFNDEKHLLQMVQRICAKVGRRVDESTPMVDARLEDGSRVNAIIPPLSLCGTVVSIRRFPDQPLMAKDLIDKGSIAACMVEFIASCVKSRLNLIVSGGTGSGKTTLLNLLSGYIPEGERVCTIEDTAELRLQQKHVVSLETRAPNIEGQGAVDTRDLVKNSLRMRPDRIVVGECRSGEALDMLQAMNTGHEGSLTTIHANNCREALSRLEMMVGMANFEMPIWIIRQQIVSAVNIVVQTSRLRGGARRVMKISEITGMEGDTISMHDLFVFKQTGIDENERATGHFECTGIRPKALARLSEMGINLPNQMFERRVIKN
ncbi:MAG: CpaF family protein [Planctomycetota bacterium]|nr:CpaF family protein [Planctomycetota bacterium]